MDPTRLQPYKYRPLKDAERDIRIIEVLPGQFDDSLRVKIHHASLTEPRGVVDPRMTIHQLKATLPKGWELYHTPEGRYLFWNAEDGTTTWEHPDPRVDKATYALPTSCEKLDSHYEAVSYVWGSDQKPHHLTVEDGEGCSQIAVTDSLMTALRHLRRPNESRRLWIDAVCINQNDPVELGSQVHAMGLIYKLAYRVVVWLGPEIDDSDHAVTTLDYFGAQVEFDLHGGWVFPAPFAEEPTWYQQEVALPYSQDTWDTILALLQRPWFNRVWVVQEVQLGSKRPGPIFQCGTEKIELSKFYRAVRCLHFKRNVSTGIQLAQLARKLINAWMLLEPMADFVFRDVLRQGAVGRSCKDGRDKVYGIIGLLPKGFASKIEVDYGGKNTASQVYKKTFLTHAQHVERLELFPNCFVAGRSISDAPSWVPDWYSEGPGERYHTKQFATGTSRAHFKYTDEEPDLLEVLGVSCAVVSHVSDYLPEGLEWQNAVDHVRQWQPCGLDTATYRPTGEPLRKAFACTLIENAVAERFPEYDLLSIDKWVNQVGDGSLFGDCADSLGEVEAGDSALGCCAERAFIQTHEGYIGLAPAETRPGDAVAIFLGCSNPLVLRPEQGRYSIVGESFVYGLEDATKLLGPLPEPWRVIAKMALSSRELHYFFSPRTGETTREDPRLETLHKWSRVDREPDGDDPIDCDFFEHQDTSVVVNYDPRLEPEMLEKRGVQLERFILV
ncbi:heterokaryon incompatibility protein [Diaporthe sp. PMI_573]|nr:heterokaryon incompatibility protein [Diaporthaceae sp. PMI_573]